MWKAAKLDPAHEEGLKRIITKLPRVHADVRAPRAPRAALLMLLTRLGCAQLLQSEGCESLQERLRDEATAALPPFMRPHPKYSHYFSWMAGRIAERFPELNEAASDKLLLMDSGQLDMLLSSEDVDVGLLLEAADKGLTWEAYRKVLGHSAPQQLLAQ